MSLPSTIFGREPSGMRARIQLRENMRGRAAELERGLGRDRLDVGDSAHAVGSENFFLRRFTGY